MWKILPLPIRAFTTGACVVGAASIPWSVLVLTNLRYQPTVPWSVPVMAMYLWAYWRYLSGDGPPRSTAELRKKLLRGCGLTLRVWQWALMSGALAVAALWALYYAFSGLVPIPPGHADVKAYPIVTVCAVILMGAAVAAVSEEAGFRGYMQVPLEARYGPISAVAAVSVAFALAHLTHGWRALWLSPLYIAVSGIYGSLAYFTNSILPALLLHFVGDALLFSLRYWQFSVNAPANRSTAEVAWPYLVAAFMLGVLSTFSFRVLVRACHRKLLSTL